MALRFSVCVFCLCAVQMASAQSSGLNPTSDEIDAFLQSDANQDGVLTKREFKTFVRAMARTGQPTARQIRFFGAYGIAFAIADLNDDGIVTPEELRAADDDHQAGKGPVKP